MLGIARESICPANRGLAEYVGRSDLDWKKFKDFIIHHELHTFAYPAVRDSEGIFPPELMEFFKINYYASIVRCQQLWQEYLRIVDAFKAAGVSVVPIKGIAFLADVYAQKPVRPMTDIDVLVKEEEIEKAKEIFRSLGYRQGYDEEEEKYWRRKQCHISFSRRQGEKSGFLLDLHFGLDFKRHNRKILPRLWERVIEVESDNRAIKLLSPEDTLFSLALHERRFGKTLSLKNVFDLALLLERYGENFDWDYILNEAAEGKMSAAIYFILFQASTFFESSVPKNVWKNLRISAIKKKLIREFILKNTFSPGHEKNGKELYLKSHFLLYDSLWEPAEYIINIPLEQFSKYYGLGLKSGDTKRLYRLRLLYMPWNYISTKLKGGQDVGR